MVLLPMLALIVGTAALWKAADEFVVGAARLALDLKLSPIVIGAVVVGFGTSAPELLVSGIAADGGDIDVGVGNVIGSNIANLSLILGSASLLVPIGVSRWVLKREAPLSVASVALFALLIQWDLSWWQGPILLVALVASLTLIIKGGGSHEISSEVDELAGEAESSKLREAVRTVIGLSLTVLGAWVLVWGALEIADALGVSGGFIGVTLVAIGTSLPELVTAIVAARHGQTELIVGNLLGSNLFNSLAVGGLIGVVGSGPLADPSLATLDMGFMLVVAVGSFIAMRTLAVFEKIEGLVLLAVFFSFLVVVYVAEAAPS